MALETGAWLSLASSHQTSQADDGPPSSFRSICNDHFSLLFIDVDAEIQHAQVVAVLARKTLSDVVSPRSSKPLHRNRQTKQFLASDAPSIFERNLGDALHRRDAVLKNNSIRGVTTPKQPA